MTQYDVASAEDFTQELTEFVPRSDFCYKSKIVNGGIAGIVGVSCVFPLDLIKTRLQNQSGKLGIKGCARAILENAGPSLMARCLAFYQGASVNILLITPEKAIKLVANDSFRYHLSRPGEKKLGAFRSILAGGLAGFSQTIVTTPMELLKIQMQQSTVRKSAIELVRRILRERGIFGLYRGVGPTMARDVTFSVIYFPLFAHLDSLGPRKKNGSGDAVFWASFAAGLSSAAIASLCVTPLDVVKTRIQTCGSSLSDPLVRYNGVLNTFFKILRNEGPKALFKGALCRVMVMAPLFGIAQTVYYVGVAEKLGIGGQCHI